MRVLLQRVTQASVKVDGEIKGSIEKGLLLFAAILPEDTLETTKKMAAKILKLRVFPDDKDVMNLSVIDKKYALLVIPQFTLYADCKGGNRPFYGRAAKPEHAKTLCESFVCELKKHCHCENGVFGADMKVALLNDGPVTLLLDSAEL